MLYKTTVHKLVPVGKSRPTLSLSLSLLPKVKKPRVTFPNELSPPTLTPHCSVYSFGISNRPDILEMFLTIIKRLEEDSNLECCF